MQPEAASKNKPRWNQSSLKPFLNGIGPARLKEDRKKLRRLFNAAALSPTAKAALDWARDNNIKFIVDHTTKANGYYWSDTGVVAIAARLLSNPQNLGTAVGTLTHEIRHGWQDKQGMIPTTIDCSFTDYFIRLSLMEADAEAHGAQSREEYELQRTLKNIQKNFPQSPSAGFYENRLQKLPLTRADDLQRHFKSWYTSWRPGVYGDTAAKFFGHALGIPNVKPTDHKMEFTPYGKDEGPKHTGIDYAKKAQLEQLGKSFDGTDYLASLRGHDRGQILSPYLAARFFSATKQAPARLVTEVIRIQEDRKLAATVPKPA